MFKKIAAISVACYLQITGAVSAECRDLNGRRIAQGIHYVPGPDACTLCVCDSGNPKWCKAVLCSPPQDCKSFRVGSTCCEFICLDDTLSTADGVLDINGNSDLGLRLIASAVTFLLSFSILFLVIHRLRQRKIRGGQSRQLSEDERSLGSIGYIAGSIGYLQGSMGYLGNGSNDLEFHYEEPPSHYPLWKPPGNYFPRGEAPPPYEEAVAAARAEAALIASTVSQCIPQNQYSTSNCNNPITTSTAASTVQTRPITSVATITTITNQSAAHRADVSTNTSRSIESVRYHHRSGEQSKNKMADNISNRSADSSAFSRSARNVNISSHHANGGVVGTLSATNANHRTIPKNLNTNVNLCSTVEPSVPSISRRDNQADITPSIEFKSLPKRSTKEKCSILNDPKPIIIRSDIFYEDITPAHRNETLYRDKHRTIPRHLGVTGLSNNIKTHSTYNISIYNNNNHLKPTSTTNTTASSSVISSLPMSPVPPPVIFSNNTTTTISNKTPESVVQIKSSTNANTTQESSTGLKQQVVQNESSASSSLLLKPPPPSDNENSPNGSYQCLNHQNTLDDEDYRSECENCKSAHGSRYYLAEDDEDELSSPNETMTLQRRPLEPQTDTLCHGSSYYRTSLTLPTNTKKLRSTSMHGTPSNHGAREAWFSSMPESTSSEED